MSHDLVTIGAGAAGEYAAGLAAEMGGRVAVVERELVGGECAFWACMPSKTLLDAGSQRALGADYPWRRASDRRDWMISREEIDVQNDAAHARALEEKGAEVVRGEARVTGRGSVEVRTADGPRTLEGRNLLVAAGSVPVIPEIEGAEKAGYWTSRQATTARDLPSSLVILGSGVVGVEMAQVFARFGTKVRILELHDRILAKDHPRSSAALHERLQSEGVQIRTGVTAESVERGGAGRIVHLSDGSTVEGSELLIAIGRRPADLRALGLEEAGIELGDDGAPPAPDEQMRIGEGVLVAGDAAGGPQFTHVAVYQGRIAALAAMGGSPKADLSAVPKAVFTDPEIASVGLTVEEARERGIDAFEESTDFATTTRGYLTEGSTGHLTAVVDRERRQVVGAFAAAPGASELIHLPALAIKQGVPLDVLVDNITAFPTGARELTHVFDAALKKL